MYCVKCGVELADSERKCPLCQTPVYFPDLDPTPVKPYPPYVNTNEKVNPRGLYFIICFIFAIAGSISVICDFNMNGSLEWSGYVVGAMLLCYVIFLLPLWFRSSHPDVFTPISFFSIALYLWYINFVTGGEWFFTLALPVTGIMALIVTAVAVLCHYLRKGYLYIFGGAFVVIGLSSMVIEHLIHVTFDVDHGYVWGPYPMAAFCLIGIMLIVIAIVKPFRESLRRIFSI